MIDFGTIIPLEQLHVRRLSKKYSDPAPLNTQLQYPNALARIDHHRHTSCNAMEGRCQCGAVRFTTPLPQPLKLYICHCLECRRQSSSAYGISAIFPVFDLAAQAVAQTSSTGDKVGAEDGATGTGTSTGTDTGTGSTTTAPASPVSVYRHNRTGSGRTKECYFCRACGSRIMHGGADYVAVKGGCLVALDRDMLRGAMHIWTKSAVVPIPDGVESYPEEPPSR